MRYFSAALALVVALAAFGRAAQASPASTAFVSAAFQVVLHRSADPAALAQFTPLMDNGSLSQTQLVQTLMNSAEFRSNEVTALYQHFLNRAADAGGLTALVGMLGGGGTAAQVAAVIAASPDYYSVAGGTNSKFLNKLFMDGVGRPLDNAGATYYLNMFAHGASRTQVATAILQSAEASNHLLLVLYQNAMQDKGSPSGTTLLSAALSAIQGMLPAAAPITAASANAAFVSAAFQVVLHRSADPAALAQFTSLLTSGSMSQAQLVQTLMNSAEFRSNEVSALYQHFLGRAADAGSLTALAGMLGSSGAATQVAAAITASPDYYGIAGGTNSKFLDKLFVDGVGRPLDTAGETYYLSLLAQGASRTQVASTILQSPEGSNHLLLVLYQNAMLRSGSPNGTTLLAAALSAIQSTLAK